MEEGGAGRVLAFCSSDKQPTILPLALKTFSFYTGGQICLGRSALLNKLLVTHTPNLDHRFQIVASSHFIVLGAVIRALTFFSIFPYQKICFLLVP